MPNVQATSVNYLPENRFRVILDGETDAGTFTKAGPLHKSKVDVVSIRTGTSLTEESKQPGNVTYEPVVLEQGVSLNQVLANWHRQVVNNGGQTGNNSPDYLRTMRIEQLDRDGTKVLCSYTYDQCWPSEYDEGSFDAESSKFRTRMIKIEYTGSPSYKEGE